MRRSTRESFARATLQGTMWTYLTYYSGKVMVFLSTIILARLLVQEDFGVAGYALVFINFLDVLSDLGIGQALIYHKEDPEAPDTAFWLGLCVGAALFIATWALAPVVAAFFQDARAIPVVRVLGLTYPINALQNVHVSLIQKELAFKRKFLPDFLRMTSKGAISVLLAFFGFGPWSLIWGQVLGTAVSVVAFWYVFPWRPSLRFSRVLGRSFLGYGLHIVSVSGLGTLLTNSDYLLIGRFLGAAALGVYTIAFRIPELLIMQFCNVIAVVIFPVYARMRDEDPQALREGFLATTRYVAMVTVPLGLGLALTARPFVLAFFTEKWVDAIPVMQAIAIYAMLYSLSYNAGDVYKAQGRPGLLTQLALLRAVLLLPALLWAVLRVGTIEAIGWTHAVVALVSGGVNLIVAGRILNVPLRALATALQPAALGGAALTLAVVASLHLTESTPLFVQLGGAILTGAAAYAGTLWWRQREIILGARNTLRTALSERG